MSEDNKDSNSKGFTVSQIEGQVKKYASEIGLCVIFAVSAIFTLIWSGSMMIWSIILCMALAIIGTLIPSYMNDGINKIVDFIYRDKIVLIVAGVVLLIIAIFIPVIIFAIVGLLSGGSLSFEMKKKAQSSPFYENPRETRNSNENNENSENDENDSNHDDTE